jgi:phosphoglycolate phosphatase-like HAD superfamily hydrolase
VDIRKIKIVTFDCDGVMFDTADINRAYYNRILEHFGKPPMTESQFRYTHTHTVKDSLLHIFPEEADLSEVHAYRKTIHYFSLIKYMIIEPYLKPLIGKIRPAYKTAIATNRSDTMERVLEEHGLVTSFDMVVTARDVERAKPYPDQLLKIIRYFDVTAKEILFIGDSELDQMAAGAIGMPFVAYANPQLEADFHINSLKEMKGILGIGAKTK